MGSHKRSDIPRRFFTPDEQQTILASIQAAESRTSGEIRLHVERDVPQKPPAEGDAYLRAREVFGSLGMHQTASRNGVLVYLATRSRRFAIVGDEQLHQKVGDGFWDEVAATMTSHFGNGDFGDGIGAGIRLIGEKLREHFPWQQDDVNELDDEISFGDEDGPRQVDDDRPAG